MRFEVTTVDETNNKSSTSKTDSENEAAVLFAMQLRDGSNAMVSNDAEFSYTVTHRDHVKRTYLRQTVTRGTF